MEKQELNTASLMAEVKALATAYKPLMAMMNEMNKKNAGEVEKDGDGASQESEELKKAKEQYIALNKKIFDLMLQLKAK